MPDNNNRVTILISSPLRLLLCLVSLVLLSSCNNLAPLETNPLTWSQHQSKIANFQQWELQGRLSIQAQADSEIININWQQQSDRFTINLSGSFGLGAVKIDGDQTSVRIEKAGEAPIFAPSLEAASLDSLGFEFPASQLYYWIRGIPSPSANDTSNIQLNDQQRLQSFQEDSWFIEYDRYQEQDKELWLPGRIKVQHDSYRLTFIIRHW